MNASLDTLTTSLSKEKFNALEKFTNHKDLLLRKGHYPYDYMSNADRFAETSLPDIKEFYNKLKLEDLPIEHYLHAQEVWCRTGCKNLGQYHDLYLLTDVLLLADIFQGFRDFCLKHYGLDPTHYLTLPSFAWDALLKFNYVELELLQDPNMYHFFASAIRGGISTVAHRHAKANNPYLSSFDPSTPSSYIMYLDANNLYGWAMKQKLPVGGFEWVGEMDAIPDDGYGYVLEVDLEYPKKLHGRHNYYPMAAESLQIPELSGYCKKLKEKLGLPDAKVDKLVPNLYNKEHYIIHHEMLRECIEPGLILKKIHRGIRFREKAWVAPYIDTNTELRKKASTTFEKDLFKLMNNAVFGKSMENVFKYVDVRLVTEPRVYEKLVANPRYRESQPFKNDLTAVAMCREKAELNKPIYTGSCVLELSKLLMYRFHYNYMTKKYGDNLKLLFTDTDSLCYHVFTKDIYRDMQLDLDAHFDTSDYAPDHFLYSAKNKKVIGLMKDETNGVPIEEFVGLRAKMYSLKFNNEEKRRAKGISKAVVSENINHDDYKNTLFNGVLMRHEMLDSGANCMTSTLLGLRKSASVLSMINDMYVMTGYLRMLMVMLI